jgi:ABC-type transport system involved in cytochrome c biogenesis permease subunit
MQRPPVTSLYETFIFVAFTAVLLGIYIERLHQKWLGIITGSIGGIVLLFIASRYSADGDTMQMLVAVLNSNFWLATHVLTITLGYGATCVAGIVGHVWLVQKLMKQQQVQLDHTYRIMLGMLALALMLTFLGTNLGGVWADQSWGRFWGWDPKENGALMIVLWIAMQLHMKVSKMIGAFGMAITSVLGVVVVVWAWFGVNLLSIGLHSYGFTSGVFTGLMLYLAIEVIFLLMTIIGIKMVAKK